MRNSFAKKSTSLGLKPWMWIGWLRLMYCIKRNHPIHIHGFSPSEIDFFCEAVPDGCG